MGMSDDNELHARLANRMDNAFCARLRAAIDAGLESAPIGVITTPGTQSPKYVPAERCEELVAEARRQQFGAD
jgi:hypothetical protein